MKYVMILLLLPLALFAQDQQPPVQYKNLKILPQNITEQQLNSVMNAWSTALGFRCQDCHYTPTGQFDDIDFADDRVENKQTAREMAEMVLSINQQHFAARDQNVTCYTCHHGTNDPRSIEEILQEAFVKGGVDATIETYRKLRERYFGQGAYNFAAYAGLGRIADQLANTGDFGRAKQLHEVNLEFNPEYDGSHFAMGCWYVAYEPNQKRATGHFAAAMKSNAFWTPRRVASFALSMNKEGKPAVGLDALVILANAAPKNTEVLLNLASYAYAVGNAQMAKDALNRALTLDENLQAAREMLKAITDAEAQQEP